LQIQLIEKELENLLSGFRFATGEKRILRTGNVVGLHKKGCNWGILNSSSLKVLKIDGTA